MRQTKQRKRTPAFIQRQEHRRAVEKLQVVYGSFSPAERHDWNVRYFLVHNLQG